MSLLMFPKLFYLSKINLRKENSWEFHQTTGFPLSGFMVP